MKISKILILLTILFITACSENKGPENITPNNKATETGGQDNDQSKRKETGGQDTKKSEELNANLKDLQKNTYKLKTNKQELIITEYSYCLIIENKCQLDSVFNVKNQQNVEIYRDEKFEAVEETTAQQKLVTHSFELELDLEKISKILEIRHFFSVYRCRESKVGKELQKVKLMFDGDWVFSLPFKGENHALANVLVVFDRESQSFKHIQRALQVEYFANIQNKKNDPSLYLQIEQSKVEKSSNKNINWPKTASFNNFVSDCDRIYHNAMGLSQDSVDSVPVSPMTRSIQRFEPLYEQKVEQDPKFARTYLENELNDDELLELYTSIEDEDSESLLINESFFNEFYFPLYNKRTDKLWNTLY